MDCPFSSETALHLHGDGYSDRAHKRCYEGRADKGKHVKTTKETSFERLPLELQEYMEDYIRQFIPRNRVMHHWFDLYDLEEERI